MTAHSTATRPSCDGDHCITCSDEGVRMRVESVVGDGLARCVDAAGGRSEVLTALVADVVPGDTLLVHAGTALTRLSAGGDR